MSERKVFAHGRIPIRKDITAALDIDKEGTMVKTPNVTEAIETALKAHRSLTPARNSDEALLESLNKIRAANTEAPNELVDDPHGIRHWSDQRLRGYLRQADWRGAPLHKLTRSDLRRVVVELFATQAYGRDGTATGRTQTSVPNDPKPVAETEESRGLRFFNFLSKPVRRHDVASAPVAQRTLDELYEGLGDAGSFKHLGAQLTKAGVLKTPTKPLTFTKAGYVDVDDIAPGTLFESIDEDGPILGMVLPRTVIERKGKIKSIYSVVLLLSQGKVRALNRHTGEFNLVNVTARGWADSERLYTGAIASMQMMTRDTLRLATKDDKAPTWNLNPNPNLRDRSVGSHDLSEWLKAPMGGQRTPR